jgi:hypothetical protein
MEIILIISSAFLVYGYIQFFDTYLDTSAKLKTVNVYNKKLNSLAIAVLAVSQYALVLLYYFNNVSK